MESERSIISHFCICIVIPLYDLAMLLRIVIEFLINISCHCCGLCAYVHMLSYICVLSNIKFSCKRTFRNASAMRLSHNIFYFTWPLLTSIFTSWLYTNYVPFVFYVYRRQWLKCENKTLLTYIPANLIKSRNSIRILGVWEVQSQKGVSVLPLVN